MLLKKPINNTHQLDPKESISNGSGQIKLFKRTSRSKSLKFDRSFSQSSLENSFPTFLIKKMPKFNSKNNEEDLQNTDHTPAKIAHKKKQNILHTQKKRLPTPSKSYRQITELTKSSRILHDKQTNLQKEMQIHDLQKKLTCQNKIRILVQQKAKQYQNQTAIQAKKVKLVEKELQQSKNKQRQYKLKIKELESCLDSKNIDLANTRTNLQKLKQNIKEVRNKQLEKQLEFLKEQSNKSKQIMLAQTSQISFLKNQNTDLKMQIKAIKSMAEQSKLKAQEQSKAVALKSQVNKLKKQLNLNRGDKQKFLEIKINQLQAQNQGLKTVITSKIIQIDFLQRKKHEQFQIFKRRKHHEIKCLRSKYSSLMDEFKAVKYKKASPSYKQTKNRSKQKSIDRKDLQKRQNRFLCLPKENTQDDHFFFELSPQFK